MASVDNTPRNSPSPSPEEDGRASPASSATLSVPNFRRGWAKGARTNFFEARVPDYTSARARGAAQVADYLVAVNNAYCKEFTWWLEPPAEPTPADLAKTDDELEPAELALKAAKMSRLRKASRNILERLSNRAPAISKMSPAQIKRDPVSALISAIANGKTYIPRARTAYQLWSKTQFDKGIKTDVDQSVIDNGVDAKSGRIRLVTGSTQQAFQNLPASERRVWELQAAAEKASNQEARGLQKKDGIIPQTCLDPVATQELLDGLVHKMDPLLKGISMLTGGNTHFYWAGPEPRRGGQINVLSMHAGDDRSPVPCDFMEAGGSEAAGRRRTVEAAIGDFALCCFDPKAQAARTLPKIAPCTAPPPFLRYRPTTWDLGSTPSFPQATASPLPTPLTQSSHPVDPVQESATSTVAKQNRTSKKRKVAADAVVPAAKRQTTKSPTHDDDDTQSDDEPDETPWQIEDDGSGEDEPPNSLPRQAGTRTSARISTKGLQVQRDPTDLDVQNQSDARPSPGPEDNIAGTEPMDGVIGANAVVPSSNDDPVVELDGVSAGHESARMPKAPSRPPPAVSSPAFTPSSSATLPPYLKLVLSRFTTMDHPAWVGLVNNFVKYETSRDFKDKRLQTGQRPAAAVQWSRLRRPLIVADQLPREMPKTVELAAEAFWRWWRFLQPDWRGVNNGGIDALTEDERGVAEPDWERLDASGNNGLVNVMGYLWLWGMKVQVSDAGHDEWEAALRDVQWAFEKMVSLTNI